MRMRTVAILSQREGRLAAAIVVHSDSEWMSETPAGVSVTAGSIL